MKTAIFMTRAAIFSLALVLAMAFGAPAKAGTAASPAGLVKLQTMVSGLGHATANAPDGKSFSFNWPGKHTYQMQLYLSQDGTVAFLVVPLSLVSAQDFSKLNMVDLMNASDVFDFYFTTKGAGTATQVFGNAYIPMSGLTAPSLRSQLNAVAAKLDGSDKAWNVN